MKFPHLSIVYGLINLWHFSGTFMNHACICFAGHVLDCSGMFAIAIWPSLYMIHQTFYQKYESYQLQGKSHLNSNGFFSTPSWISVLFPICASVLVLYAYFLPSDTFRDLFMVGILMFSGVWTINYYRTNKKNFEIKYFYYSTAALAVAYIFWRLDTHKILICCPRCVFQGHAVWHILTSLTIIFFYLFFRSEKQQHIL